MSNSPETGTSLNFEQIKAIIPQRFPFMMLDRVIESRPGISIVGLKNLTGNEWFYQGHFPKKAVTPGALLCEAIAQTGIVFFAQCAPQKRDVTYLLGALRVKFLRPAWPGDQLRITVTPQKVTANAAILNGEISVDGNVIAKGEFALSAKENSAL